MWPNRLARLLLGFAFCAIGAGRAETIHVYLLGGQSNADGHGDPTGLPSNLQSPQTDVPFYSNVSGGLTSLQPRPTNFGPEITFGRSMADYYPGTTSDVAILKYALGGTNLYSQWAGGGDANPTNDGSVYQSFETTIRAGLAALKAAHPTATLVIDGMVWVQGESDLDNGASSSAAYGANLTNLIQDVRATFSPTMEFMYSRISDNQTVYSAGSATTQQNYNTIRAQQQLVSTTVSGTKMLDIDGSSFTVGSDNLHFDAAGQQALGYAFASAAQSVLAPGFTATGVNWTGATDTVFETATNWSGSTAPANDTTTNFAVFSGSPVANQPAVTADRSVGGLQFGSTGGWTVGGSATLTLGSALTVGSTAYVGIDASALTSGTDNIATSRVQLASNQTWLVGTGGTLNVTSAVTGNSLVFGDDTRAGALILGGSADNTGLSLVVNNGSVALAKTSSSTVHAVGGMGLFINGGSAQITGAGGDQIQDSVPIVFNGGSFDMNGHTETIAGLSGSGGTVTNTSGTAASLTVGGGSLNLSFQGTITNSAGALSLSKIGSSTQTLSGANTYTGTTSIGGGTLLVTGTHTGGGAYTVNSGGTLGGSGTITPASNAGVTIASGGKLAPGSSNTSADTLTLKLSGTGILDISGAVGGANTGALVFNLGSTSDKLALTTGTLAIGSGVLNFDDFNFVTISNFPVGTYTLIDTNATISGSLGSSLTGTIGGYTATLSLGDSNRDIVLTLAGVSFVYSWDSNGTAAGSGAATGTWDSGASAIWNTDSTGVAAPIATTTSVRDDVKFSAGTNGTTGTITVSGTQSANTMAINQSGLTFTGGTIALAGGTTGSLTVNASATINSALTAKSIIFGTANQTLKLGGGSTSLTGASASSAAIGLTSTLELTAGTYAGSSSYNLGNVATGTGGLVVDAGATFSASSMLYIGYGASGLLNVNGGTLNQTGSSNLIVGRLAGNTGRLILSSGTINHTSTGSLLIGFQNGTGILDVQGGALNVTAVASALVLNSPGATTGAGGTATVNLSGNSVTTVQKIDFGKAPDYSGTANAGSGTLNVKGGALYIGSGGLVNDGTGSYTATINLSGGTVGATADWSSSVPMILSNADGGVTFKAANAANTAKNITLSGALSGSGGLTKSGAGTLTLTGSNSYTGATTITQGTLSINTPFLSDTANLFLSSGAIFNLNFSASTPDTIAIFYLDGVAQSAGTYGAIGSTATFQRSYFTGTGLLNVTSVPEPGTWPLLGVGLGALAIVRRRWKKSQFDSGHGDEPLPARYF